MTPGNLSSFSVCLSVKVSYKPFKDYWNYFSDPWTKEQPFKDTWWSFRDYSSPFEDHVTPQGPLELKPEGVLSSTLQHCWNPEP